MTPADLGADKSMYVSAGRRFLSQQGLRESSATLLPPGAVIFSSRAPIGYVAVAANELATNQGCRSFICAQGVVPEFLYFALQFTKPLAEQLASGTTFLEISGTNAGRIPIWLPPTSEQHRIASRLKEIQESLRRTRIRLKRAITALKRFRQSVLAAACSGRLTADWREDHQDRTAQSPLGLVGASLEQFDLNSPILPDLPDGWNVVGVGRVARKIQYGTSAKGELDPNAGIPVLRMGNIQNGRIDLSNLKYTDRNVEDVARCIVESGDILFNRTNSPELVGKAAVYDLEREVAFASYLVRVKCDDAIAASKFVCYWINSPWGRTWAAAVKTDGVSQSNINASKLAAMPLPLPSRSEQGEIVNRVEILFELATAIESRVTGAIARVDNLTQAILAKAFRGELVPTETELAGRDGRDYEPASVPPGTLRADPAKHGRANGRKGRPEAMKRQATLFETHL